MTLDNRSNAERHQSDRCLLVILHESQEALARARKLCDDLMGEFWAHMDIEFHEWPLDGLLEETASAEAASKAAQADVVVVAAGAEGDFTPEFIEWAERLAGLREHREGALVALLTRGETTGPGGATRRDMHLHRLAVRAGMDYLQHLPERPPKAIPDLTEWCAARASKFTGTLDQIIRTEPPL